MPSYATLGTPAARLMRDLRRTPLVSGKGLVWLLAMDESGGTTVYDRCTRNIIDGTLVASPTLGVDLGKGFKGITFNGSTQYVTFTQTTALQPSKTAEWAVVALLNVTNTAAVKAVIGNMASGGSSGNNGWGMRFGTDEKLIVRFADSAGNALDVISNSALTAGALIMPGFSKSASAAASSIALYNNGASIADTDTEDALTGSITYNQAKINIASVNDGTSPFAGTIGLIAAFDRAMAAADFRRWAWLAGLLA